MEFDLPDPGEGIAEATLVEWHVEPGDAVDADDAVASVETDKAVVDIPIPESATINELHYDEGDTAIVDEPLLSYEPAGEVGDTTTTQDSEDESKSKHQPESHEARSGGDHQSPDSHGVLAMPRVKHKARQLGVDLADVDGSGPGGRVVLADLPDTAPSPGEDWEESTAEDSAPDEGTALDTAGDEAPAADADGFERVSAETHEYAGPPRSRSKPGRAETTGTTRPEPDVSGLSGPRKAIAEHMRHSLDTTAQTTITAEADVTRLVGIHDRVSEHEDQHITYLAYFSAAATQTLQDYPRFNATFDDDLTVHDDVNLGIAVDTDRGLFVPVIPDAAGMSVRSLAAAINDAASATRSGEADPSRYEDGTFTISSLGSIAGDAFTPILNTPEVAVLGIGAIKQRPRYVDGSLSRRDVVTLSLTVDHQVIDGADAARFLDDITDRLAEPGRLLVDL